MTNDTQLKAAQENVRYKKLSQHSCRTLSAFCISAGTWFASTCPFSLSLLGVVGASQVTSNKHFLHENTSKHWPQHLLRGVAAIQFQHRAQLSKAKFVACSLRADHSCKTPMHACSDSFRSMGRHRSSCSMKLWTLPALSAGRRRCSFHTLS